MKITTVSELIHHIAHYKEVNSVIPLFAAYDLKGQSFVQDNSIGKQSTVIIGGQVTSCSDDELSQFLYVNGVSIGSLKDRNIPENHYNNHWWFTTREEAEEHIKTKEFEVGEFYEWIAERCYNEQKPSHQGGQMECVYATKLQGIFKQRDGYLATVALGHMIAQNPSFRKVR